MDNSHNIFIFYYNYIEIDIIYLFTCLLIYYF